MKSVIIACLGVGALATVGSAAPSISAAVTAKSDTLVAIVNGGGTAEMQAPKSGD